MSSTNAPPIINLYDEPEFVFGVDGGHIRFMMTKGAMNSHISQFPVATHKKGHRHVNTGDTPARYLALKHQVVSVRNAQGVPKTWISRRIGGDQIDYADESPVVRETVAKALAERGLEPAMGAAYEAELADLPPLPIGSAPIA